MWGAIAGLGGRGLAALGFRMGTPTVARNVVTGMAPGRIAGKWMKRIDPVVEVVSEAPRQGGLWNTASGVINTAGTLAGAKFAWDSFFPPSAPQQTPMDYYPQQPVSQYPLGWR